MKTCSACGYWKEPNDKENISFHLFPKKENIRQEWIKAIGSKNFVPTKSNVLCSQHFLSNCFYYPIGGTKQRVHLKPGSVPTIFGARFSRKRNMFLKQNLTYINSNIDSIVEENNAIVKLESKCFEADTTDYESNEATEITSSTNYTADDTCQMRAEDTMGSICQMRAEDTMGSTCQMRAEDTYKEHPGTLKHKRRRYGNLVYVGDCSLSDLQSPRKALRNWKIAISYINEQRRKLARIRKQNYRLKKKVTNLQTLIKNLKSSKLISDDAAGVLSTSVSEASKAIFNRQLNNKSRKIFPQSLRTFATTLQFYSTKAYNYVRNTFMNSLPHPKTITKWYQKVDGTPGITKESIETLKLGIAFTFSAETFVSMHLLNYFFIAFLEQLCSIL